nr:potassium-transporting ATPase subunit F [Curtobacterium sp. WW7]
MPRAPRSPGVPRVRRLRRRRCPRRVRRGGTDRQGGGATVIAITIAAAVLGLAAVVYLVWALVRPEKF